MYICICIYAVTEPPAWSWMQDNCLMCYEYLPTYLLYSYCTYPYSVMYAICMDEIDPWFNSFPTPSNNNDVC
jgi:hypothetical protein